MSQTLELHPLCTLFPRIAGNEFDALKADIAANGLRQPIVLHEGFILDGGNRYRACMEIGVEPDAIEFDGGNLVSYVLSANMHRRHLSPGQQAAIVASAQDWATAQTVGKPNGATLHHSTVAERATQSGASVRTQKMADKVAKESPELAKKVAHGEISLPKAHEQISPKIDPIHDPDMPEIMRGYDPSQDVISDADLLAGERQENAILHAQVDALNKSDHAAEIEAQVRIRYGIEQQNSANMNKVAQLDKELRYLGKLLAELRKIMKVATNAEILTSVKAMLKAEA